MPTIARVIAVLVALLLALGAAAFLFLRSPASSDAIYRTATAIGLDAAPPERHVVSEDFQGWAVVHFGVDGAPPLREEDGTLVIEYPASGRLETSTPAPEAGGFIQRGYYRQSPHGLMPLSRATEIWGEFSHIAHPDGLAPALRLDEIGDQAGGISPELGADLEVLHSTGFFVGSMTEFRATEWPVEHGRPVGADQ
jgi:hypothetical protein